MEQTSEKVLSLKQHFSQFRANIIGIDATFEAFPDGGSGSYLYSWDFDGDGNEDASTSTASYNFTDQNPNVTLILADANHPSVTSTITEQVYFPDTIAIDTSHVVNVPCDGSGARGGVE